MTPGDGLALESEGGKSSNGVICLEDVALTALDIGGKGFEIFGVHPVNGGFKKATIETGGDGIGDGLDGDAAAAEICFKILGVVNVPGKPGVGPDEEGFGGAVGGAEIVDHAQELTAPDGGRTRGGGIDEPAQNGDVVLGGVTGDDGVLLIGGEFLIFVTGVAEIGYGGVICRRGHTH